MPIEGSSSQNPDKTMNYSISGVKDLGDVSVSAGAFVNNYRTPECDKISIVPHQYTVAGANVALSNASGNVASVSAQHIPTYGNQVTAATNINLLATENHRVDANAFTTHSMPKGPMPAYQTHGGGIDYQYKNKLTAGASVARTPMFKQTDYSVSSGINLHQTPTSSVNLNVEANRTDTQLGSGKWEPRLFLGIKKTF